MLITWTLNVVQNAGMVFLCEILVDVIKHSFLAKFNEIKPGAYSEFLQALCKQVIYYSVVWFLCLSGCSVHPHLFLSGGCCGVRRVIDCSIPSGRL